MKALTCDLLPFHCTSLFPPFPSTTTSSTHCHVTQPLHTPFFLSSLALGFTGAGDGGKEAEATSKLRRCLSCSIFRRFGQQGAKIKDIKGIGEGICRAVMTRPCLVLYESESPLNWVAVLGKVRAITSCPRSDLGSCWLAGHNHGRVSGEL